MDRYVRRFASLSLIGFLAVASLWGQTKPRIAVLPLSSINVSGSDAQAITSLFETALVKTGVFNVIEQNQIKAILDAQRFSLQGCTDESCAVEVGKLLAAEQIVIGELSRVGNRFILNAKIIDVQQGKNIRADNVSASSLEEIADTGAAMLAAKLAGLTYQQGGGDQIATSFGELFIATEPPGAEVFVNGISRGTSPCLVERVPVGKIVVSARKDNLYCETPVELKAPELMELNLRLEVALGRLFVKSSERGVTVYLDTKELGPLGAGLFKDLPAGEHALELKGEGLYWSGRVAIEPGKTVTVEAFPVPYGTVKYLVPEGASALFSGPGGERTVTGDGELKLGVGSYAVRCAGEWYQPYETRIEVQRGQTVSLAPRMSFTAAHTEELARNSRQVKADALSARMDDIEARLDRAEAATGASSATMAVVAAAAGKELTIDDGGDLVQESRQAAQTAAADFPELQERAGDLYVRAISYRLSVLESKQEAAERSLKRNRVITIVDLAVGAAGFVLGGIMYSLAADSYEEYSAAVTSAEAAALREQTENYAVIEALGFGVGGIGMVGGLGSLGRRTGQATYLQEIGQLRAELAEIGGER